MESHFQEFPGALLVRIPGFHCHGPGSIPSQGTEIAHTKKSHSLSLDIYIYTHSYAHRFFFPYLHLYIHFIALGMILVNAFISL